LAFFKPVAGNRADAGHDAASSVEVVVEITPQEGLMVRGPDAQEVELLDVVLDGPLETVGVQVRVGEGVLEGRDPQSGQIASTEQEAPEAEGELGDDAAMGWGLAASGACR